MDIQAKINEDRPITTLNTDVRLFDGSAYLIGNTGFVLEFFPEQGECEIHFLPDGDWSLYRKAKITDEMKIKHSGMLNSALYAVYDYYGRPENSDVRISFLFTQDFENNPEFADALIKLFSQFHHEELVTQTELTNSRFKYKTNIDFKKFLSLRQQDPLIKFLKFTSDKFVGNLVI